MRAKTPRVPRRHYYGLRVDEETGEIYGKSISGCSRGLVTRGLAPTPEETQETLIKLRTDFYLSRGELAAYLAVSEPALKAWECGKRVPLYGMRRLIWLIDGLMRDNIPLSSSDLLAWERGTDNRALADT